MSDKLALYATIEYRRDYEKRIFASLETNEDIQYVNNHIDELEHLLEHVNELPDDADVFFS